jgi:hypothetical protein
MAAISKGVGGKAVGEIKPEVYFLKYAFPCAFISLQRGKIDKKTYQKLEKGAVKGEELSFKELKKYFPAAFARIENLKSRKGYKKWDIDLIRDYFWNEHNVLIRQKKEDYKYAPKSLCDLCKVFKGRVVMADSADHAVVKLENGKKRAVMTKLTGKLSVGDKVMVHYGYAVERMLHGLLK